MPESEHKFLKDNNLSPAVILQKVARDLAATGECRLTKEIILEAGANDDARGTNGSSI